MHLALRLYLEQKYYKKGKKLLDDLLSIDPIPDQVKNLYKEWEIHDTNVFNIDWKQTDSQGSQFSNEEELLTASFYTAPIADNWRGFATYSDKHARFWGNTQDHITTQGLGINYRNPQWDVSASIFNVEGTKPLEFSLGGTYNINDYSRLNAQYQSFSDATPIRAFHADIYTQSLRFGGSYNPNEEYQFRANVGLIDFTDSNKRKELSLDAYQPLYRDEHHILNIWEYAYVQTNSLTSDRPYFNPKSFVSVSVALDYTGIIRRKYDNVFSHSLRLGFGAVKQNNYSTKPFLDITYKHRWDFSRYFNLYYGLGYRQNYYDGVRETSPNYFAGLEYKF